MSFAVQPAPIRGPRWELAQRIAGEAGIPSQSLQAVFTGALQGFQKLFGISVQENLEQKLWTVVSHKRLKTLQETLIQSFCDQILQGFKDEQIAEMLAEHKQKGKITNQLYTVHIQVAYGCNRELINNSVTQKAALMNEEIAADIAQVLKQERVIDFESNSNS